MKMIFIPIINIKVVSTIAALEKEISYQLDFLNNFMPLKPLSESKQKRTIFCGTGDSFASAQLAEALSEFRVRAVDPLDMIKTRDLLKGHDLYLISISGNTVSNIKLAKYSKRTTAITANPNSRLAKSCKNVILLNFKSSGIQTAGSISFLASALTCISLVAKYAIRNPDKIYYDAERLARKIRLSGKIYLLGNVFAMPTAMYCAAKLYETLGTDVHYQRIEQFSHMELFSAKKGDTVIIFDDKNAHNKKLLRYLRRCSLNPIVARSSSGNRQEKILFYIFLSQLLSLYLIKKKNKKECFFVEAKKLRNASSSMIY